MLIIYILWMGLISGEETDIWERRYAWYSRESDITLINRYFTTVKKYMIAHGYDIVDVTYGKLSGHLPEEIQKVFGDGWNKAVDTLKNVDFSETEDIVFLSKSIGTVISARYAAETGLKVRNIYFTPLELTMQYASSNGIAFHGTADPLVNTDELTRLCEAKSIPLYTYEGGNHSIETKDILWNIKTQKDIAEKYIDYLNF